ncbi:MAG: HDOD domain-containing protein [Deltaproteobacteria bacterium]|nr:HDOD domain-containing protein [Deltaproteobacteria bacterium]
MRTRTGCTRCTSAWAAGHDTCPHCGTPASTLDEWAGTDPLIGQVVGNRFRVEERLGEGGMGVVYRAEQQPIHRRVALKVLHSHLAPDASLKARFVNEAAAASRLNHPNTVTLYDFGETETGTLYIAMEYVDGRDLREVMHEERPLAWRRTAAIMAQIARSLDDAHAHGVVHRDLKPGNVMVFDRGPERDQVKVLDFGVAKLLELADGSEQITRSGALLGTPQFLAPESIRGEVIDHRVDIYALGVMLYEALAGRPPFAGKTVARLLTQHLMEEPLRPSRLRPDWDAPFGLESLTLRMLEKDPEQRPSSMREVAERLEGLLRAAVATPSSRPAVSAAPEASQISPSSGPVPDAPAATLVLTDPPPAKKEHKTGQLVVPKDVPAPRVGPPPPPLVTPAPIAPPAPSPPAAVRERKPSTRPVPVTAITQVPAEAAREGTGPVDSSPSLTAGAAATSTPEREPAKATATAAPASPPEAVERLFERMRANPDFPALAQLIGEINVQAGRENTSAAELASVILRDVALASKLLRLVNSTYHGPAAGTISTISHAIVLLGFDAVRDAALTLLLVNRTRREGSAPELAEIVVGSLLAANMARELGERIGGRTIGEQAYLCGLFGDLGRYLAAFYFPDEWREAKRVAGASGTSVDTAAEHLLGVPLATLGRLVAETWGFPATVADSMATLPPGTVARPRTTAEHVRQLACLSREVVSALTSSEGAERAAKVAALAGRFGHTARLDEKSVTALVDGAVKQVESTARAARLPLSPTSPLVAARGFLGREQPVEATRAAGKHAGAADPTEETLTPVPGAADRVRILLERLHEISLLLSRDFEVEEVVEIILETAFTGFEFENVFFAGVDPLTREATITHALGKRLPSAVGNVHFTLGDAEGDLFVRTLLQGQDLVVGDSDLREVASKLPGWYRPYRAAAFALYPVVVDGVPCGIFYVDGAAVEEGAAGSGVDHRLGYMNRLRNSAVLALRKRLEGKAAAAASRSVA